MNSAAIILEWMYAISLIKYSCCPKMFQRQEKAHFNSQMMLIDLEFQNYQYEPFCAFYLESKRLSCCKLGRSAYNHFLPKFMSP